MMSFSVPVKNLVSFVFLLYCYASITHRFVVHAQDVPRPKCVMKEFARCAEMIGEIKLDGACQQVDRSKICVEKLVKACGLSPSKSQALCSEAKHDSFCQMLDFSSHAPMSSPLVEPALCMQYRTLYYCHQNNCVEEPRSQFRRKDPRGRGPQGSRGIVGPSCSKRAATKCVGSLMEATEVTASTCKQASFMKYCFLDELDLCSGSEEDQISADVLLAGLIHHVKQCKEKGYPTDKAVCPTNPADAFIPNGVLDSQGYAANETTSEDYCRDVHSATNRLGDFTKDCNVTSYQTAIVDRLTRELGPIKKKCSEDGFKGSNSAPRLLVGYLSQVLVVMATGLVLFVTHKLC